MTQHNPHLASMKCRCGHGIDHPSVEAKPVWGFWGWLKLFQGIATTPRRVQFRCRECGTILGSTTDRDVLQQHK